MRLDDNEIRISGARRAKCRWLGCTRHRVEGLALPKSVESGKLSLNKVVIRSMRLKSGFFRQRIRGHEQMAVLDARFYGWEIRTK